MDVPSAVPAVKQIKCMSKYEICCHSSKDRRRRGTGLDLPMSGVRNGYIVMVNKQLSDLVATKPTAQCPSWSQVSVTRQVP